MKLLPFDDYIACPNAEVGISSEQELRMISECLCYVQKMATQFKISIPVTGTAMTIFHLYQKRVPFTEFDRYMLSTLCVFIAGKIDYTNMRYEDIMRFYYANRKGPKAKTKPFEALIHDLREDFTDLEMKVLTSFQFDFEFDSPFRYLKNFKNSFLSYLKTQHSHVTFD